MPAVNAITKGFVNVKIVLVGCSLLKRPVPYMRSSDATRKADRGGGESRRFVEDEEIFKNEIETRWYTGYFIRSHRYRVTRSNSSLSTFEIGNCADDRCVSLWIVDFWQVTYPPPTPSTLPPFPLFVAHVSHRSLCFRNVTT